MSQAVAAPPYRWGNWAPGLFSFSLCFYSSQEPHSFPKRVLNRKLGPILVFAYFLHKLNFYNPSVHLSQWLTIPWSVAELRNIKYDFKEIGLQHVTFDSLFDSHWLFAVSLALYHVTIEGTYMYGPGFCLQVAYGAKWKISRVVDSFIPREKGWNEKATLTTLWSLQEGGITSGW